MYPGLYLLGTHIWKQPGHKLLNLATGQVIVHPKIRELSITDLIIDAVEKLTDKDGIKSMKFSRIDGLPFEDPVWIAGVKNDENEDNENLFQMTKILILTMILTAMKIQTMKNLSHLILKIKN